MLSSQIIKVYISDPSINSQQSDQTELTPEQKKLNILFFLAIQKSEEKNVLAGYLKQGAKIEWINGQGKTAIDLAVEKGNIEVLNFLLDSFYGDSTPQLFSPRLRIFSQLMKYYTDKIKTCNVEILKNVINFMFNSGYDLHWSPDADLKANPTLLESVLERGDIDLIKFILSKQNYFHELGTSIAYYYNGVVDDELGKLFLSKSISPKFKDNTLPICLVAENFNLLSFFLKNGANPNYKICTKDIPHLPIFPDLSKYNGFSVLSLLFELIHSKDKKSYAQKYEKIVCSIIELFIVFMFQFEDKNILPSYLKLIYKFQATHPKTLDFLLKSGINYYKEHNKTELSKLIYFCTVCGGEKFVEYFVKNLETSFFWDDNNKKSLIDYLFEIEIDFDKFFEFNIDRVKGIVEKIFNKLKLEPTNDKNLIENNRIVWLNYLKRLEKIRSIFINFELVNDEYTLKVRTFNLEFECLVSYLRKFKESKIMKIDKEKMEIKVSNPIVFCGLFNNNAIKTIEEMINKSKIQKLIVSPIALNSSVSSSNIHKKEDKQSIRLHEKPKKTQNKKQNQPINTKKKTQKKKNNKKTNPKEKIKTKQEIKEEKINNKKEKEAYRPYDTTVPQSRPISLPSGKPFPIKSDSAPSVYMPQEEQKVSHLKSKTKAKELDPEINNRLQEIIQSLIEIDSLLKRRAKLEKENWSEMDLEINKKAIGYRLLKMLESFHPTATKEPLSSTMLAYIDKVSDTIMNQQLILDCRTAIRTHFSDESFAVEMAKLIIRKGFESKLKRWNSSGVPLELGQLVSRREIRKCGLNPTPSISRDDKFWINLLMKECQFIKNSTHKLLENVSLFLVETDLISALKKSLSNISKCLKEISQDRKEELLKNNSVRKLIFWGNQIAHEIPEKGDFFIVEDFDEGKLFKIAQKIETYEKVFRKYLG